MDIEYVNDYTVLITNSFTNEEEEEIMNELMDLDFKYEDIVVYGKTYTQPRETLAFSEDGKNYSFNGTTFEGREYPDIIHRIRRRVYEALDSLNGIDRRPELNYVWLNRYNDGKEKIGWHSDDEEEISDVDPIVSVSFGQERYFDLRHKKYFTDKYKGKKKEKTRLNLGSGDILVMFPRVQELYKHQVPKQTTIDGTRINLTFRTIE